MRKTDRASGKCAAITTRPIPGRKNVSLPAIPPERRKFHRKDAKDAKEIRDRKCNPGMRFRRQIASGHAGFPYPRCPLCVPLRLCGENAFGGVEMRSPAYNCGLSQPAYIMEVLL